MRRVLAGVTSVVATVLVGGVAWVALQTATLEVVRSTRVEAAPEDLFPMLDDLTLRQRWDAWRPPVPDEYTDGSETTSGVGAWMAWEGGGEDGEITTTAAQLNRYVVQEVRVWEPMPHLSVTSVSLARSGQGTEVTYALVREQDFTGKMIGLLSDQESAVGEDLENRLVRLKAAGEVRSLRRAERASREKALIDRAAEAAQAVSDPAPPGPDQR